MTEAQAEADARNASLAQINPKRAQQIEWYAGKDGRLYLRDKPRDPTINPASRGLAAMGEVR